MRILFWQNIESQHQSSYIRALAADKKHEVILVTQDDIPAWRVEMGWKKPDYGFVSVVHRPDKKTIKRLVSEKKNDSTHIFTSLGVYPMVHYAFTQCPERTNIGIISEAHVWKGAKGPLRQAVGKYRAYRYGKKINFILAIGTLGYRWFRMCGFPPKKIYPFGYFVEEDLVVSANEPNQNNRSASFRIGYTGQLIHRKGLDLLIKALAGLKEQEWVLDVVGDGEKRIELKNLCNTLDIADRVIFHGSKSNLEAVQLMQKLDLFVLPSRWDGWGAVVNEALMCGVPVVCSDLCGSADLIGDDRIGELFEAGNILSLRSVLLKRINNGKKTKSMVGYINKWSESIGGMCAADYLLSIIDASASGKPKPLPPWARV